MERMRTEPNFVSSASGSQGPQYLDTLFSPPTGQHPEPGLHLQRWRRQKLQKNGGRKGSAAGRSQGTRLLPPFHFHHTSSSCAPNMTSRSHGTHAQPAGQTGREGESRYVTSVCVYLLIHRFVPAPRPSSCMHNVEFSARVLIPSQQYPHTSTTSFFSLLQVAKQMELQVLFVHVEADNHGAMALYTSSGFKVQEEEAEQLALQLRRPRRILLSFWTS